MSLYKFPLQETNVCCTKAFLKMIFPFPRWSPSSWQELERDRLEMAAELAHRGPTQSSKVPAIVFRRGCCCERMMVMITFIYIYIYIY